MTPETVAALLQLGLAGIGLYLFAIGFLRSRKVDEEADTARKEHLAQVVALYEARIAEGDKRYAELRADRDAWKSLTLGTERRLDQVVQPLAAAVAAPVPLQSPAPPEAQAGP